MYSAEITHVKNIHSGKMDYCVCLTGKIRVVKQCNYDNHGVRKLWINCYQCFAFCLNTFPWKLSSAVRSGRGCKG